MVHQKGWQLNRFEKKFGGGVLGRVGVPPVPWSHAGNYEGLSPLIIKKNVIIKVVIGEGELNFLNLNTFKTGFMNAPLSKQVKTKSAST